MNFLQKLLNPNPPADPFGIDRAVDGIRQLRKRVEDEKNPAGNGAGQAPRCGTVRP